MKFLILTRERRLDSGRFGSGQMDHKRRHLEGHLLARGQERDRLILHQDDAIGPRIHLDARPERQRRDLLQARLLQRRRLARELAQSRQCLGARQLIADRRLD